MNYLHMRRHDNIHGKQNKRCIYFWYKKYRDIHGWLFMTHASPRLFVNGLSNVEVTKCCLRGFLGIEYMLGEHECLSSSIVVYFSWQG